MYFQHYYQYLHWIKKAPIKHSNIQSSSSTNVELIECEKLLNVILYHCSTGTKKRKKSLQSIVLETNTQKANK